MNELDELLEVVDENNQVISKVTRGECYKKGLLHRAVNIFIYNSKGEVFLHKRSDKKLKYPSFWDLSGIRETLNILKNTRLIIKNVKKDF